LAKPYYLLLALLAVCPGSIADNHLAGSNTQSPHASAGQSGASAAASDPGAAMFKAARAASAAYLAGDPGTAIDWWQRAHELGYPDAAFNLGLLLLRETATVEQGRQWLHLAAATNDPLACFVLGTSLAEDGRTEWSAEALKFLECAASQGYAPAQYNLATLLAGQELSPATLSSARAWYAAAAITFAPARGALSALPTQAPVRAPATAVVQPGVHGIDWVMSRPSDYFTVQIGVGRDTAALEAMLKRHVKDVDTAWFLHRPAARAPYSAIAGAYADQSEAEQLLAGLPASLKRNGPWVRRFATLHAELALIEAPALPPPSPE